MKHCRRNRVDSNFEEQEQLGRKRKSLGNNQRLIMTSHPSDISINEFDIEACSNFEPQVTRY